MNRGIMQVSSLMRDLVKRKGLGYYEGSTVTKLLKDCLAGNTFAIGLFCLR